jgi:hypothetical protein
VLFALAVCIAGCGDWIQDREMHLTNLHDQFACGDLTVGAASRDDTIVLIVEIEDDVVAQAADGVPQERTYNIHDAGVRAEISTGTAVSAGHCSRGNWEESEIDGGEVATQGGVEVSARYYPPDGFPQVDVSLTDVRFRVVSGSVSAGLSKYSHLDEFDFKRLTVYPDE